MVKAVRHPDGKSPTSVTYLEDINCTRGDTVLEILEERHLFVSWWTLWSPGQFGRFHDIKGCPGASVRVHETMNSQKKTFCRLVDWCGSKLLSLLDLSADIYSLVDHISQSLLSVRLSLKNT